jgi:uncharacterized membrane protein
MRGHHPFLALLCVLALIVAIGAVIWLLARNRGASRAAAVATVAAPSPTRQAEAILAERLARGEVTPDDYRATLAALRDTTTSA